MKRIVIVTKMTDMSQGCKECESKCQMLMDILNIIPLEEQTKKLMKLKNTRPDWCPLREMDWEEN